MSLKLNHRAELYGNYPAALSDQIDATANRGLAIIELLQPALLGGNEFEINKETSYAALESIRLDLLDIKAIADDFYRCHKKLKPDKRTT